MAKHLTPAQKKKVVAVHLENGQNVADTARRCKISRPTVDKIIKEFGGDELVEKLQEKKQEENKNVLEWLSQQSQMKIEILDSVLKAIKKKADNPDMFTSIKDLAFVYGIISDKEYKALELQIQNAGNARTIETDKLSEALEKIGLSMNEEYIND